MVAHSNVEGKKSTQQNKISDADWLAIEDSVSQWTQMGDPTGSQICLVLIQGGQICNEDLRKENYKAHFGGHPSFKAGTRFKCQWQGCNDTMISRQKLLEHLETHVDKNIREKFTCSECQKEILREDTLQRHMRDKHQSK
ncbi:hypothetical protein GYMLUDRAFT_96757 [Collybiopsis luxurians FD-317 M1]|uniref:C2H2-type domain-containing protein n=1 Tax=Collybiopsis luxurians FD-317 M1 TaxID=944289 RepID=A0A0D0CR01_9AGAR|nr:hypothetical protein GYMLUDRAFT_96757 [Collybiopsis luxurians FD-317 M1]